MAAHAAAASTLPAAELAALLQTAQAAAEAGAAVVQEALDKPRNIQFKGATDLVTECARASRGPHAQTTGTTSVHRSMLATREGGWGADGPPIRARAYTPPHPPRPPRRAARTSRARLPSWR